jgi:hypothetical protein
VRVRYVALSTIPNSYIPVKQFKTDPIMIKVIHLKEKFYMISEAQRARKECITYYL